MEVLRKPEVRVDNTLKAPPRLCCIRRPSNAAVRIGPLSAHLFTALPPLAPALCPALCPPACVRFLRVLFSARDWLLDVRISVAAKVVCVIDTIVAVSTVAVLWTGSVPAYSRPYLILMVTHRCDGCDEMVAGGSGGQVRSPHSLNTARHGFLSVFLAHGTDAAQIGVLGSTCSRTLFLRTLPPRNPLAGGAFDLLPDSCALDQRDLVPAGFLASFVRHPPAEARHGPSEVRPPDRGTIRTAYECFLLKSFVSFCGARIKRKGWVLSR